MSNRFWVGGTGTWDSSSTTHWAATSGGVPGAAVPLSTDDVFFDGNSGGGTITMQSAGVVCRSFDHTGWSGTLAGSGLGPTIWGYLTYSATSTYSSSSYTTTFADTSGTVRAITPNGKCADGPYVFNGAGGSWQFAGDFGAAIFPDITLTAGTLDFNGKSITCRSLTSIGTTTRALTFGAAAVHLGSGSPVNDKLAISATGMTLSAAGATITINAGAAGPSFAGGGLSYGTVAWSANGGGDQTLTIDGSTFANLSITPSSAPVSLKLSGNITVGGTLTLTGNDSGVRRLIVSSDTPGTARTMTAAAVALTDIDLQDITGAGAASPFTGARIGDALGNAGVTFTTPQDNYWVGLAGGNWSASSSWATSSGGASGARVPLPQDNVFVDANSITSASATITADCLHLCKNLNFTGVLNLPTFTANTAAAGATNAQVFGSLTYGPISLSNSGGTFLLLAARSAVNFNPSTATGNLPHVLGDNIPNGPGTVTLTSALTLSGTLTLNSGIFNIGANALSVAQFASTGGRTRSIVNPGATWLITGANSGLGTFTVSATGLTATWPTTIKLTNASATKKSFDGGGMTFNNLWLTGAGTGVYEIDGSNTFADFKIDTPPHTVSFQASATITVTTFSVVGTAGNLMTLQSTSAGSAWLLHRAAGIVACDYLSLKDSHASGGATFYAGSHSTNVSGNTGWIFASVPVALIISAAQSLTAFASGGSVGRIFAPISQAVTKATALQIARSITMASATVITRQLIRSLQITMANVATATGQLGAKQIATTVGQAVTAFYTRALSIVVSSPLLLLFARPGGQFVGVNFAQVLSIRRAMTLHPFLLMSPLVTLLTKAAAKSFWANLASLISEGRSFKALVVRAWPPAIITIARPRRAQIGLSQSQKVRLLRRMARAIAVSQAQTSAVIRRAATRISVLMGESISGGRSIIRRIGVRNAQAVVIGRRMARLTAATSAEAVHVVRSGAKAIAVHLGNVATLTAKSVKHYSQAIVASMAVIASLGRRRGKYVGAASVQVVAIARMIAKTIVATLAELVTIAFNGLIRRLTPSLFAFGVHRRRSVFEEPMSLTQVLSPPIEPDIEYENIEFDYGLVVDPGVKIVSAVLSCTVFSGTDSHPGDRLIGPPVVAASARSGNDNQAVVQMVGNAVADVVYSVQCAATLDDGQVKVLTGLLPCTAAA